MATANGDDGPSFFAQFIDGPEKSRAEAPAPVPLAAGRLLHWLTNNWKEPVISTRNICQFGPRPRDKESALRLADILEKRGWLVRMTTNRHDAKWWRIAIGD